MSSVSGVLQDKNNNDIYPYTFDTQVLDSNNVPLNQRLGAASEASSVTGSTAFSKINTLNTNIGSVSSSLNSVSSDLGSKSSASSVTGNDAFSKINTLYGELLNPAHLITIGSNNTTNWKNSPLGFSMYKYEQADTTTLDIPIAHCIVFVLYPSFSRGVAFAATWANGTGNVVWMNRLHDSWAGWSEIARNNVP